MEIKLMKDFRLSPHFTFFEMTHTNHRNFFDENRNVFDDVIKLGSGAALCSMILEPIREHFEKPIIINSGYRCKGLNTSINGSRTSQHLRFEAADFYVPGVKLEKVFEWIYTSSDLRFGQVILEGFSKGRPTWIHISLGAPWRSEEKCGQVYTWNSQDGYKLIKTVKWWK